MELMEDKTRLLRRLTASRQKWKQRVAEKQDLIRALRVRTRDLESSRAFWKKRALAAAEIVVRNLAVGAADSPVSTTLECPLETATRDVGEQ